MGQGGKHKKRLQQLRTIRDRFYPSDPDRAVIGWAIAVLQGQVKLSPTGDISVDTAPQSVLRWRTRYAEIRIAEVLLTLDAIHNTCGCCCPGGCILAEDWVPESVRRTKVDV